MVYDVVVIGGGASGMIAAGTAGYLGKKVLLLEKNEKLGKKLYITGKGRCNITNMASKEEFFEKIPRNSKFLYSAFSTFFNEEIVSLLNILGLETKVERGGRIFPKSDKSSDVIKAFQKYLLDNNVLIRLNSKVVSILHKNNCVTGVKLENGETISTASIIIATGGLSYPMTGSDGDGYTFAKSLGHEVTDLNPSLVPLVVKEDYVKSLQGLTLKNVTITAESEGKTLYKEFGEMLFTHFGLSGPLILSASFFVAEALRKSKKVYINIDLKPYIDFEELNKRILKDFELSANKQFKNSLDSLLPKKIIPIIIRLSEIPEQKLVNQITKEERKALAFLLKNLKFEIIGTRPISEAIITSGGVSVKEINPKTMESKLIKGLFFAGEVLDVDAFTGGFNLQIAFSTGYIAGLNT